MMDVSDSMTDCSSTVDVRARRRKLHTEAEQRRRDAIKRGFDGLLELIPPTKTGAANSHFRLSKATILSRSINMIIKGSKIQNQKRTEIEMLKKNVQALQTLKSCYERVSDASNYTPENEDTVITEQYKLQLFQMFMESLFQSFDAAVTDSTFNVLVDQIVNWLENSCKPELLHQTMEHLLDTTLQDGYNLPNSQPQRIHEAHSHSQNTMFEVQTATDCMGQRVHSNSYRGQPLKLSNSLEGVHEPQFLMSESSVNVPDHYQQPSNVGCQHAAFNPSTGYETSHSAAYPDQSQHQQQTGYVRSQPPFQMHSYQSSDDGKYSTEISSNPLQRHSSLTPPSQSTIFQRSPSTLSGLYAGRSLVVNSSVPTHNFGAVTSYVPPQQQQQGGIFIPSQIQYNNSGGSIVMPNVPFTKQSPF